MTDGEMTTVEVELTPAVLGQVDAAAELTGRDRAGFVEQAILTRLEALDNVLYGDPHTPIPPEFDTDEWRKRWETIRERRAANE